jgi:hypothetical protein
MNRKLSGMLALISLATLALAACGGAVMTEAPPTLASSPTKISIAPTKVPSTDTPAPTAVTQTNTPLPTQGSSDSATPGVTLLKIPPVNCCRGRALKAGTYEVPPWLGIPLTVELGEDWVVLNEKAALLFLIGRGQNVQNNPSQMIVFQNVTDKTTPEALIGSVQQAPELTASTEPISVTVAGFAGLQLDSTAKPNPSFEGSKEADIPPRVQFLPVFTQYFSPGFTWITSSPEARVRTVVVTVDNQTLLLYLEAPPNEFDQFAADSDSILQSLELIEK